MTHRLTGLTIAACFTAMAFGAAPGIAQTFDSGSTGADGAFSPATTTTVTLPPSGVFNFTTIDIPAGVTVRFTRNAANTPVTLLASGSVTIAGTIDLNGSAGDLGTSGTRLSSAPGLGGPGGFDGGIGANGIASTTGGSGLGPGGGQGGIRDATAPFQGGGGAGFANAGGNSAGLGGAAYGTPSLLPLIGGSGGGGGSTQFGSTAAGGGGGGGAILIASSGTITYTGTILSRGGSGGGASSGGPGGGGSGGAVRLAATTITGTGGSIQVTGGAAGSGSGTFGGSGSIGRVRIEAFSNTATISFGLGQVPSVAQPSSVILANSPTLRIASVAGVAAPASPASSFSNPDITLPVGTTNPMTVNLEASNIPLGTTITVTVSGQTGGATSASSTGLSGTLASSTASASVTVPLNQPSIIGASASFQLVALGAAGPVFVEGEEIDRVNVTASLGGTSRVAYITKAGREVPVPTQ